ncbi:collagen-like protein [Bacillus hominis]|uniref:collagen-like triple helix repeat-containing protein n=1 Tax=Bacillus hominis TaxID=2817478 RepID=UPI0025A0B7B6|nr:collagen-like protein [Bacillus hominis]MDM5431442.1 collagen-like protein [Bacillus hominis]
MREEYFNKRNIHCDKFMPPIAPCPIEVIGPTGATGATGKPGPMGPAGVDGTNGNCGCDCCALAIQEYLRCIPLQSNINVGVKNVTSYKLDGVILDEINEYMIKVKKEGCEYVIPICHITSVFERMEVTAVSMSEVKENDECFNCCEGAVEEFLKAVAVADFYVGNDCFQCAEIVELRNGGVIVKVKELGMGIISICDVVAISNIDKQSNSSA